MEDSQVNSSNKTEETFNRIENFFEKMAQLPHRERVFFSDILEGLNWLFFNYEKDGYHKGYDPHTVDILYRKLGSPKTLKEFAVKARDWAIAKNGDWDDMYATRILHDMYEDDETEKERLFSLFTDKGKSITIREDALDTLHYSFEKDLFLYFHEHLAEFLQENKSNRKFIDTVLDTIFAYDDDLIDQFATFKTIHDYSIHAERSVSTHNQDYNRLITQGAFYKERESK